MTPYNAMANNPISYNDPNGDFIFAAVMGAMMMMGSATFSGNANSVGSVLSYGAVGALSGGIGAGVGGAVAGSVGSLGFAGGALSGAAGGAAAGFVGSAGNAWLGGASFGAGFGAGLKGAGIGGLTGALVGGVSGGISALSKGGNFWNGKGATFESFEFGSSEPVVGEGMEYSNKYARTFSDKHFGKVEGLKGLYADGTFPDSYTVREGIPYNSKGQAIRATTVYHGKNMSSVYLAKSVFSSQQQLYLTMGHEYMHVGFNANTSFREMTTRDERHATIYKWQSAQAKIFEVSNYPNYLQRYNSRAAFYCSEYDCLSPALIKNRF